jgi:hypothetical protein
MKVFVKMVGESWDRKLQIKFIAEFPEDRSKLQLITMEMEKSEYYMALDSALKPEDPREGGIVEVILEKSSEPPPPPDRDE